MILRSKYSAVVRSSKWRAPAALWILMLVSLSIGAGAQVQYQEVLDVAQFPGPSPGLAMDYTSRGTLAVAGFDRLDENFLFELDRDGNLIWSRKYGGFIGRIFNDLRQTNGGFAVLGQDFGTVGKGAFLMRTDSVGQPSWKRLYTVGSLTLEAHGLELTADRGFAVTGYVGGSPESLFVLKLDSAGSVQWGRFYTTDFPTTHLRGRFLRQTADGGYVVTGDVTTGGNEDVYVAKLDANGVVEWARHYGGSGDESGVTVRPLTHGYVVSGRTDSFGAGNDDVYLLQLDLAGNLLWSRTYGGSGEESEASLTVTSDGDFVVSGSTSSFGAGGRDLFLLRIDSAGQLVWGRAYGGIDDEHTIDHHDHLAPAEDQAGGFRLVGETQSFPAGGLYLVATDDQGDVPCNATEITPTVSTAPTVLQDLPLNQQPVSWTISDVDLLVFEPVLTPTFLCHESPFCIPPPENLEAWYSLDGSAEDSAFALHAVVEGDPMYVAGMVGQALDFDGSGDALTAPHGTTNDVTTNDFSIDLWARVDPNNPGVRVFVEKREMTPRVRGYSFYVFNGELRFQMADGAGPSSTCSFSASASCTNYLSGHSVNDGAWHFLTVTVDRDDPTGIRWYVDGVEVGTRANPTVRSGSLSNSGDLHIGRGEPGTFHIRGTLDEVEIFPRVLQPAEIQALYHSKDRGKCKNRIGAPWDISMCLNDTKAQVPVEICNDSTTSRTYELSSVEGIRPDPHKDRCSVEWQPTYTSAPGSLVLGPGDCGAFTLEVDRPANLNQGRIACLQATFTDSEGPPFSIDSSLWDNGNFCCRYPVAVETFPSLLPRTFEFPVTNTSGQPSVLEYRVEVMPPPGEVNDVVRLNGQSAGIDIVGSIALAPGETGIISFEASMIGHRPGRLFDLLLIDTGSDPERERPLASFGLRSVPGLGTGDEMFSDGFESGNTSAWSFTFP